LRRAQVLQWMCFEQYSHEPYVATSRFIVKHMPADSPRHAELPDRMARGRAALAVMDGHLAKEPFFVGGAYTLADIALYAYTHVAHEAGFDLTPYKALGAWIERVAGQPGYVSLYQRPSN
jgi:glutathione S-transferase